MQLLFFGFWDSYDNNVISKIQQTQIFLWATSLLFFHKNAVIHLYTRKEIIPPNLIKINGLKIVYFKKDMKSIFINTPLENFNLKLNNKAELSDSVRVALLYKYGGTWLDIDDIAVRPFPTDKNIIGTFLWLNKKTATYWGSTFDLVEGSLISDKFKDFRFHIQNDPMINWEIGNKFLYEWMQLMKTNKSTDWGQKLPTNIISNNNNIIHDCNIYLTPQHYILLHPAFGNSSMGNTTDFGYPKSNGPMFPPYDLRIKGLVNYDSLMTREEFWGMVKQTLYSHSYCCVKNQKNIGIEQSKNKQKRWFIGYIADTHFFNGVLSRFDKINNEYKSSLCITTHSTPLIMFKNDNIMGQFPYKNYNFSILKLNEADVIKITNNKYTKSAVLVTFYASLLSNRFGTMSWIGIISYENLSKLLDNPDNNNELNNPDNIFWIIKPHLIQNDLGPKSDDLRIFKLKNNIAIIGYSRVACKSNIPNIQDYYVRASILNTRINDKLYDKPDTYYHFNEIDGSCFPSKIGNNYKKFHIKNDNSIIHDIEFYIENNNYSKIITPHKSKVKLMPNNMKLNGIEVSFSKTDSNENSNTHISSKNINPLHHKEYLDNIGCFIDISPYNSNKGLLTIQDLLTGKVHHTDTIIKDNKYKSINYRGSTPFIELSNNIWITLVHDRHKNVKNKYNTYYSYYFVFYDSKQINILGNNIVIPNKCIYETQFDATKYHVNDFIFITGLIVDKELIDKNYLYLDLLISYGITDEKSGISKINLTVPNNCFY